MRELSMHGARALLCAVVVSTLLVGPRRNAAAQRVRAAPAPTLLLRVAPEDRHAYLVWNDIPQARYSVQWREQGTSRWSEIPGTRTSAVVPELKNDRVYDFQVIATLGDRRIPSRIVRASPRIRTECEAGGFG